jgi:tetratricopeptide (TPR) repeat protein
MRDIKIVVTLLAAVFVLGGIAACGGPQTPPPAGPPTGGGEEVKEAPKRQITKAEAQDFAGAVRKYNSYVAAAKKGGAWSKGDCQSAAESFKDVAGSHPKISYDCLFNAGVSYEHCGLTAEAMSSYEAANSKARSVINREYAPALVNMGRIFWLNGDHDRGEDHFRRAVAADPKNADARNALAVSLYEKGKRGGSSRVYEDAIGELRRALAVDVSNMGAYTTLALIYYEVARDDRSKLDLAALVCKQAKDISKTHAPIYNISGLIWLKKKNVTRALEDFRKAVEYDDNLLEAHMNIGAITLSYRDYASAETSFKKVLARRPNDLDALIGVAVALRGKRQFDQAEAIFNKVGQLDPKNPAVPFNLGLIYQDYKDYQEPTLLRAKAFYQDFLNRPGAPGDKVNEAKRRIKNIDEIIAANKEAKLLQAEAEKNQKLQEEQEKKAREEEARQKALDEEKKKKDPKAAPKGDPKADPKAAPKGDPKAADPKADPKK